MNHWFSLLHKSMVRDGTNRNKLQNDFIWINKHMLNTYLNVYTVQCICSFEFWNWWYFLFVCSRHIKKRITFLVKFFEVSLLNVTRFSIISGEQPFDTPDRFVLRCGVYGSRWNPDDPRGRSGVAEVSSDTGLLRDRVQQCRSYVCSCHEGSDRHLLYGFVRETHVVLRPYGHRKCRIGKSTNSPHCPSGLRTRTRRRSNKRNYPTTVVVRFNYWTLLYSFIFVTSRTPIIGRLVKF